MDFSSQTVMDMYKIWIEDRADPRVMNWPLVRSPWHPITAAAIYVYFCWNAKPLTAKMPVYHIRPFLLAYNSLMVLLSCYMTYEFFAAAYLSGYNLLCQPVDYTSAPLAMRMAKVCWLYYFSKYIELIETVAFALRKKYNQISFLHVYHHTTMLLVWWSAVKYTAGGQAFLFGGFNSFVHAVMYIYYGLSACGPQMHKYLWWKKYITVLQLSQFVILFFYCIQSVISDCKFASWLCKAMIAYAITLLVLFSNFFLQAYVFRKSEKGSLKQQEKNNKIK